MTRNNLYDFIDMMTILGLRNPEDEYGGTRHNIGADVVHAFVEAQGFNPFKTDKLFFAEKTQGDIGAVSVRVLLPTTYMNESGKTVAAAKVAPQDIVVVHDELALPVGTFTISYGRSAGGHNGVESVINACGTNDIVRLRIGISPAAPQVVTGEGRADFVLKPFTPAERTQISEMMPRVVEALALLVREGKDAAMRAYN